MSDSSSEEIYEKIFLLIDKKKKLRAELKKTLRMLDQLKTLEVMIVSNEFDEFFIGQKTMLKKSIVEIECDIFGTNDDIGTEFKKGIPE